MTSVHLCLHRPLLLTMNKIMDTNSLIERTGIVFEAVEEGMDDIGELAQTGVVWLSMGFAIWQSLLIATQFLSIGNSVEWKIT